MLMFPWLDLMDSLHPVTKEEIQRTQQLKHLLKPAHRYHLPFKYKQTNDPNAQPNGHCAED